MYNTSDFQPDIVDSFPGSYGGDHVVSAPIETGASSFATVVAPVALSSRISGLSAPYPTNVWWTNLFMGDLYVAPLPYLVKPTTTGFGVSTQSKVVAADYIITTFDEQVSLNATESLNARTVTGYDDLTVTLKWPTTDNAKYLQACLAQGMGLVTIQYYGLTPSLSHGGSALLSVNGNPTGSSVTGTKFKLEFNSGKTWVVYASSSITLSTSTGDPLVASAPFTGTLQVALITVPGDEAILDAHANTYVTAGTVTPSISNNIALIDYDWTTTGTNPLLMHALPHHMDVIQGAAAVSMTLNTMKGATTGISGASWTLREVLPTFGLSSPTPIATDKRAAVQAALVADVAATYTGGVSDPYFGPKYLARWARLAQIADELGDSASAATARSKYKADLVAWLDGTNPDPLRYDTRYKGIISTAGAGNSSADFGNGIYNDHHFHYGYIVYAAAVLAHTDSAFLTSYKSKVNELVRDYANPSTSDTRFTKFRHKDWYHGHSWAQGLDNTGDPKNQESSSEAINGYYAMSVWGLVSNQSYLASVGQVLLATEIHSTRRYWHVKASDTIYPAPFNAHKVVGIVWGSKVDYATFFGANAEFIHGIQMLPFTPITKLYLEEDWITEEYPVVKVAAIDRPSPVITDGWKGLLVGAHAVIDPGAAWTEADALTSYDDGNSETNLLHWIATRSTTQVVSSPRFHLQNTTPIPEGDLAGTYGYPELKPTAVAAGSYANADITVDDKGRITAAAAGTGGATPDATTSTKGQIQLAGDLGGTAASPTVPGLTAKAPLASPTFTGVVTAPTLTVNNQLNMGADPATTNGSRFLYSAGTYIDSRVASSSNGISLRTDTTSGMAERFRVDAKGWTYAIGNTGVAPSAVNGLAMGWNKSGGDGETNLVYSVGAGTNPRLSFASYNGTTYTEEMNLKSGRLAVGQGSTSATASIDLAASTTSFASLRLRTGVAPTSPNAGDVWSDGTSLSYYNGDTVKLLASTLPEAQNIALGTTTGTKIGTATTQKLSLWNQTPIVQPAATVDIRTLLSTTGLSAGATNPLAPRIVTTASSATPTPDAGITDQYTVTALAAGATFGAPTGTPTDGQKLMIRIKDNGTAQTLAFNAIYRAMGVTLPTTTVISKTLYLGCAYNSADTKWDVLAVAQEA